MQMNFFFRTGLAALLFIVSSISNASADTTIQQLNNTINSLKQERSVVLMDIAMNDEPNTKISVTRQAFFPPNEAAMKLATESYDAAREFMMLSIKSLTMAKERLEAGDIDAATKYIEKSNSFERAANIARESIEPLLDSAKDIGANEIFATACLNVSKSLLSLAYGPAMGMGYGALASGVVLSAEYEIDKNLAGQDVATLNLIKNIATETIFTALDGTVSGILSGNLSDSVRSTVEQAVAQKLKEMAWPVIEEIGMTAAMSVVHNIIENLYFNIVPVTPQNEPIPFLLSMVNTPNQLSNKNTASFSFIATKLSTLQYRVDGSNWITTGTNLSLNNLSDGAHRIEVRARDAQGNISNTREYSWTVDTKWPTVSMASKPTIISGSNTANFSFLADESVTLKYTLSGSFVMGGTSQQSGETSGTTINIKNLGNGQYALTAQAIDKVGHITQLPSYSWHVLDGATSTNEFPYVAYQRYMPVTQFATIVDTWMGLMNTRTGMIRPLLIATKQTLGFSPQDARIIGQYSLFDPAPSNLGGFIDVNQVYTSKRFTWAYSSGCIGCFNAWSDVDGSLIGTLFRRDSEQADVEAVLSRVYSDPGKAGFVVGRFAGLGKDNKSFEIDGTIKKVEMESFASTERIEIAAYHSAQYANTTTLNDVNFVPNSTFAIRSLAKFDISGTLKETLGWGTWDGSLWGSYNGIPVKNDWVLSSDMFLNMPIGPAPFMTFENYALFGTDTYGTQWSSDKISGRTYGYGGEGKQSIPGSIPTESPFDGKTWIMVGETIGTFDAAKTTYQGVQAGQWIETNRFLAMTQTVDGRSKLNQLNIPCVEVGTTNLSGSAGAVGAWNADAMTVNMANVKFFSTTGGSAPKIWASGSVTGNYSGNPKNLGDITLNGASMTTKFAVQQFDTTNNKWVAQVKNGSGTLAAPTVSPGNHYTQPIVFRGAAAGNINTKYTNPGTPGTFSGTAAGLAK